MTAIWVAVVDGSGPPGVTYRVAVLVQRNASLTLQDLELPHLANLHVMMDPPRQHSKLQTNMILEVAMMKSRR